MAASLLSAKAAAQFTFIGPGSTPQGDVLRGEGVALSGLGFFNLATAQANMINTQAWMTLNQYLYEARMEERKRFHALLMRRKENNNKSLAEIQKRLRESPTETDLRRGDALNVLLDDLTAPTIHPSTLRYAKVPLVGGTLQRIPLHLPTLGGVISMRQLTVDDDWPIPLRAEAFAVERRNYLKAVDRVLEQELDGRVSPDAVQAVRQAVDDLRDKMEQKISIHDRDAFLQSKNFIDALEKAARLLQQPAVDRLLAEMERYPGTTVGDLLEFMQRHNLQFSEAVSPADWTLYRELYEQLCMQRTALKGQMRPREGFLPGPEDGAKGDPLVARPGTDRGPNELPR